LCSTGSKKENDLSRRVYLRKQKYYNKIDNFHIIGLSRWIEKCAKESSLLKDKKIIHISNLINTGLFKIIDKKIARSIWNFPADKKLVLIGAVTVLKDPRKGIVELKSSLKYLKNNEVELVVFGSGKPKDDNFGFKTHYLGNISDDVSLVALYNAVDVVVVPSIQENLSNVIMESLSCATPVVAFNIGGNSDMIEHKKNGYLVKPFIAEDFGSGIEWILSSLDYETICKNAREKVLKEFDSRVVAKKYIKLYSEILN
jgi:glycosyltransferase involved in cell wall biosynthesis